MVLKSDPRGRAKYRKARKAILASRPPCSYGCGRPATEADHVVPVIRGGSDDVANLRPACRTCNRSRGAKPLGEWQAAQARGPQWVARTIYARPARIF